MLLDADLSDAERQQIFGGNAQHVFGLAVNAGAAS
jgi:hypothetical protein